MSTITTLRLAVCLFPDLTLLDFIGPVQLFGFLQQKKAQAFQALYPTLPPLRLEPTYFSHDQTPVVGDVGPAMIPQKTYKDVLENFEQYDVILIPGGVYNSSARHLASLTTPVFVDRCTRGARVGRPIAHRVREEASAWREVHLDGLYRVLDPRRYRVVEWEEGDHEQGVL